ncbi:MAG TPA: hypothetical protein VHA52_08720 [Candidatus Babeliaceae bacterium]|nr:hypothetical protein [Candidatus Babeliaceae bacterium]
MTIQALKGLLNNPEFSFLPLRNFLASEKVYAGLTFWGERVVKIEGEEGSISLNVLADKVVSAICNRCLPANPNTFDDNAHAARVVSCLASFYQSTDKLIAHANTNCFTRILAGLRDAWAQGARADIRYLHMYPGFKKGYAITRWPWYRGPPEW